MNQTEYPCDLKLWIMYSSINIFPFMQSISIKRVECNLNNQKSKMHRLKEGNLLPHVFLLRLMNGLAFAQDKWTLLANNGTKMLMLIQMIILL